jgi:toluene monooxygenase system protein E
MSQAPARKLRTWSGFGQIRRKPSEYEIVTHDANYTTRKNRTSALEGNPTTPINMWYLTYRDHSPLSAEDWNGFRDPDEVTYRKYVTMQDEQETFVEGILDEFGKVNHDAALSPQWVQVLATVFTPMRYPSHVLQMQQAYLGQVAPTSYITNCAAFAAADQFAWFRSWPIGRANSSSLTPMQVLRRESGKSGRHTRIGNPSAGR